MRTKPLRAAVPERITRALEHPSPTGADRILEIGCGPGVAVSLLCPRLRTGRILALDRSATAIARARARNASFVAAQQAGFIHTELADARLPSRSFDLAFAINVNAFWTGDAARELSVVRHALKARGVFWLFYEPPTADTARLIRQRDLLLTALAAHGFPRSHALPSTARARPFLAISARR